MKPASIYSQHVIAPPEAANDNRHRSEPPTARGRAGSWIEIRIVHTETIRSRAVLVRGCVDPDSTDG